MLWLVPLQVLEDKNVRTYKLFIFIQIGWLINLKTTDLGWLFVIVKNSSNISKSKLKNEIEINSTYKLFNFSIQFYLGLDFYYLSCKYTQRWNCFFKISVINRGWKLNYQIWVIQDIKFYENVWHMQTVDGDWHSIVLWISSDWCFD